MTDLAITITWSPQNLPSVPREAEISSNIWTESTLVELGVSELTQNGTGSQL